MKLRENMRGEVFRSFAEAEEAERKQWAAISPAERVGTVWQLSLDAWAFTGDRVAESRLPRHVVHIHRPQR